MHCHNSFKFTNDLRYATGLDYAGEHRDDEKELDADAPIASLSLGAARDFYFKHGSARGGRKNNNPAKGEKAAPPRVNLVLEDGMLLLMNPPTNKFWWHGLPVRKKCQEVRINLTFRRLTNI